MSKIEIVGLLLKGTGSLHQNSVTVVSGLLFKSKDLSGRVDNVNGVGSLGLLIFNIGIQGVHLGSHILEGLCPHSNVGVVADNVLCFGRSNSITKVLKKNDDLLTSGWADSLHLNEGSECADQWEVSRAFFHSSSADLHGHILELTNLEQGSSSGRRGEAPEEPDGLVTGVNGLGVISLSDLVGGSFGGDHFLMLIDSSLESLSLRHIIFNLLIKVI